MCPISRSNIESGREADPRTVRSVAVELDHGRRPDRSAFDLVSVVIPTYNRAALTIQALESVYAQTYRPLEVIVVDDASIDNTASVVQKWQSCHNEESFSVVLHRKPRNEKLAAARNTGIQLSKGEFVAFLDSDDTWMPDKLEKQMAVFQTAKQSVGLVYTGAVIVFPGRKQTVLPQYRGPLAQAALLGTVIIGSGSGVLIRRQVLQQVGGFDPKLSGAEDQDMWIRILERYEADFVSEALVRIFIHQEETRLSNNYSLGLASRDEILQKHETLYVRMGVKAEYMRRVAWYCHRVVGDSAAARRRYMLAFRAEPNNYRALMGALLTFAPDVVFRLVERMRRG